MQLRIGDSQRGMLKYFTLKRRNLRKMRSRSTNFVESRSMLAFPYRSLARSRSLEIDFKVASIVGIAEKAFTLASRKTFDEISGSPRKFRHDRTVINANFSVARVRLTSPLFLGLSFLATLRPPCRPLTVPPLARLADFYDSARRKIRLSPAGP